MYSRLGTAVLQFRRVSNRALTAVLVLVLVLVVTGVVAAWLHGLRPENATQMNYGLLVLLKAGLLLPALAAAGVNRLVLRHADTLVALAGTRLYRIVLAESITLFCILLVASALARSMPPH